MAPWCMMQQITDTHMEMGRNPMSHSEFDAAESYLVACGWSEQATRTEASRKNALAVHASGGGGWWG
jgi:pyridoxine/pyridoxamine 5'-phosphate oxidase